MKDYCVILLEAPGRIHVMQSKKRPDLETVHELVECDLVESVNLQGFDGDYIMLVDESGWLKEGTFINVYASIIYSGAPDSISGNALILKRNRYDWEALTLNETEYLLKEIDAAFELFCESL